MWSLPLCGQFEAVLEEFLGHKARTGADGYIPTEVVQVLRDLLAAGGKRLRPVLCICGWWAGGGEGCPSPVIQVAAALELFHTFALIHDDVMDQSETRRGRPTVHRALAAHHSDLGQRAADQMGISGAILIGDLALVWSDELVHTAGLSAEILAAVLSVVDTMHTEIMAGQYLDVISARSVRASLDSAITVIRYKTVKYTLERPLHLGALLAGAERSVLDALSAFALPLGEAFQLRDDILGVFGDLDETGKPVLDDLREGKHTVLLALAYRLANRRQAAVLSRLVGDPALDEDGADVLREILVATGARTAVEEMIHQRYTSALTALDQAPFALESLKVLRQLAHEMAWRSR